jgi:hypothetical protein
MKVAAAVRELERQYEEMRMRAEAAEGKVRVYEARDRGAEIARSAVEDGSWRVHWKNGDDDPVEFSYSPGMWLLGLAESFLKHPMPFELRVAQADPTQQKEVPAEPRGQGNE